GGVVDAEAEGFAQFVEARQRALQRAAWLVTGDWALAEDLVQTALVRSWPRWERIRRRDDPEIYVRRAMVNSWTSWRRRRWWGERATGAVPDSQAAGDGAAEGAGGVTGGGGARAVPAPARGGAGRGGLRCPPGGEAGRGGRWGSGRWGRSRARWRTRWPGCARTPGWPGLWTGRPSERDGQAVAGPSGGHRWRTTAPGKR